MPTFSMMCGFKVCFLIHGKRALAQINYRLKRNNSFKWTVSLEENIGSTVPVLPGHLDFDRELYLTIQYPYSKR
jgi:hypothetical protein